MIQPRSLLHDVIVFKIKFILSCFIRLSLSLSSRFNSKVKNRLGLREPKKIPGRRRVKRTTLISGFKLIYMVESSLC